MSWYYVDPSGATKGPMSGQQLKPLYGSAVKDNTYVWNGTSVAQWTALSKIPELLKILKPSPKPAPPLSGPGSGGGRRKRRRRRRRKNPMMGGGGRASLLDAIRKGKKLTNTPAPKAKDVTDAVGGGGGGGGGSGKTLSLMEQMKAAQAKRKKGGGGRGSRKRKTVPKPNTSEPAWKKKQNAPSSSAPKKTWREKQEEKKRAEAAAKANKGGGGGGGSSSSTGSLGARKDKIVDKLKNAQEWQLKAIEKILQ